MNAKMKIAHAIYQHTKDASKPSESSNVPCSFNRLSSLTHLLESSHRIFREKKEQKIALENFVILSGISIKLHFIRKGNDNRTEKTCTIKKICGRNQTFFQVCDNVNKQIGQPIFSTAVSFQCVCVCVSMFVALEYGGVKVIK